MSPGFFETLRIPVRRGRPLTPEDRAGGRRVAVIDEEFVRRYWPKEDPIGKRITFGPPAGAADTSAREWIEIVGVVGHTKHEGLDADARLQLYLPYAQVGRADSHGSRPHRRRPRGVREPDAAARCSRSIPTSRSPVCGPWTS